MIQQYRGPLLAGLIFAAFLVAFLALVHPGAFAQTMGEYGGVLNDSTSGDKFKPPEIHPSEMNPSKYDSDIPANSGNDFQPGDVGKPSDTFKSSGALDSKEDFKTGGDTFKPSDDFKPSFKTE